MGATGVLAMQGVGTATSAYGSYAKGQYNQKIADYNASVADMQARDAISRGKVSAAMHNQRTNLEVGSQRAHLAAQGIDIGSGSAADVQANTRGIGTFDAMEIQSNAQREAWGYRSQATGYRSQGQLDAMSGMNNATGTLLTGSADSWLTANKLGLIKLKK